MARICRTLIRFRRQQPTTRRRRFPRGDSNGADRHPEVGWYDASGNSVDWHGNDLLLTCLWTRLPREEDHQRAARDLLLIFNATQATQMFTFPPVALADRWRLLVDTAAKPPNDVFPSCKGPPAPKSGRVILKPRSLRCYISEAPW